MAACRAEYAQGASRSVFSSCAHSCGCAKCSLAHKELGKRLDELERKVGTHDRAIGQILEAIRQLTQPPEPAKRRRIGFL